MPNPTPVFRNLPFMGVIRVNVEAMEHGFRMGHPDWANLGQGQPEVGEMEGAPKRMEHAPFQPEDHAYGAIEGIPEMREAVAAHYNRLYRQGKPSQYTAENVAMAPGGRAALTRIGASLDDVRLGYFTPDYTAYEDLLTTFPRIEPVWIELGPENGWTISPQDLEEQVKTKDVGALLISNPCNPTGAVIHGDDLKAWVELSRNRGITLLMDEFYSHFFYGADHPVSSAAFVEDVNEDQVIICDGLTKSFRYPGWRVGWVVAPKTVIRNLAAAGSFLDGGPCRPIQRAAIEVLQAKRADQETKALRNVFSQKQKLTLETLKKLGVKFQKDPQGTFYVFGYVGDLPAPFNDGLGFMRKAFEHKVLTVPGEFFDVNPNRNRPAPSKLNPYVRFSFGPDTNVLQMGLDRLTAMLS